MIENVSHLSELRVLNLAGNNITRLENLQGLDCLTELNLRHNSISVVVSILFYTGDIFNNFILIHNLKAKTAQSNDLQSECLRQKKPLQGVYHRQVDRFI